MVVAAVKFLATLGVAKPEPAPFSAAKRSASAEVAGSCRRGYGHSDAGREKRHGRP